MERKIEKGDSVMYRDFKEDEWATGATYVAYDESLKNSPYYDGEHLIKIGGIVYGTKFIKKDNSKFNVL